MARIEIEVGKDLRSALGEALRLGRCDRGYPPIPSIDLPTEAVARLDGRAYGRFLRRYRSQGCFAERELANICNRVRVVQLELPRSLRQRLVSEADFLQAFAIRSAILSSLAT